MCLLVEHVLFVAACSQLLRTLQSEGELQQLIVLGWPLLIMSKGQQLSRAETVGGAPSVKVVIWTGIARTRRYARQNRCLWAVSAPMAKSRGKRSHLVECLSNEARTASSMGS
eukprot:scpid79538/ scgid29300/ 